MKHIIWFLLIIITYFKCQCFRLNSSDIINTQGALVASDLCQLKVDSLTCEDHRGGLACLFKSNRCDGFPDCRDGSDESPESCGCLHDEFFCNGTCIDLVKRCDQTPDCVYGDDEKNCESFVCRSSHFKCDNHFCVPDEKVCDHVDNCGDGSDERNCEFRRCWHGEYKCKSGQCIRMNEVCNGIKDCVDSSDEEMCDKDLHFVECNYGSRVHISLWCDDWTDCVDNHKDELHCRNCSDHEITCNNSRCIQKWNLCDGVCDCLSDCSDEANCEDDPGFYTKNGQTVCLEGKSVQCHTSDRCIQSEFLCDGFNACLNTASTSLDEIGCGIERLQCEEDNQFWCKDGRCLPPEARCNHRRECLHGEDEEGCPFTLCDNFQFNCSNGQCIQKEMCCDTVADCLDKSDELNCELNICVEGQFKCNSGQCIPLMWTCDYRKDCPDGEDEMNCNNKDTICGPDEYQCKNQQCVFKTDRCYFDGNTRSGCADKSHLINCSSWICEPWQTQCRDSYCIDTEMVCDGRIDCIESWSDEIGCPFQCSSEQRCACLDISINCSSLGLNSIPSNIESEISRFLFSHNNLGHKLNEKMFQGLERAQILDLSWNEITEIPSGTFKSLWQLKILYLNNNRIDVIGRRAFVGLSNLRSLVITGNQIKAIHSLGFSGLSSIKALDLSNQGLENISTNAFLGMRSLASLDLSYNNLTTLFEGTFNGLSSLIFMDLSRNKLATIEAKTFNGLVSLRKLITDEFRFCCLVQPSVTCYPQPDEFSSCEDLMSNFVLRVCVWILGIIALTGNVLVIVWRVKHRSIRIHSFLIANLALGDFLMGVYLMIIACVDSYYRGIYFIHDSQWRKSFLCQFCGFLSTLSSESSVLTLTVVTLDRFVTIVFPFHVRRLQLEDFILLMSAVWIVCFCIAALPLFPIPYFDNFYGRSGVCLALHITRQRPNGWEYSVFVFLVLNLISFAIIAFAYCWMFFVAYFSRKSIRATVPSKTSLTMARRIMVIIFSDFFCWMPIILLGFLSLYDIDVPPQIFAWVAVFVLPLNAALNPIIYTISTPSFCGVSKSSLWFFQMSIRNSETQRSIADSPPGPTTSNKSNGNRRYCFVIEDKQQKQGPKGRPRTIYENGKAYHGTSKSKHSSLTGLHQKMEVYQFVGRRNRTLEQTKKQGVQVTQV